MLINGVGVSIGETAGAGECKLPVIDFEPDKTYRMPFNGTTAISMVQLAVDGHENSRSLVQMVTIRTRIQRASCKCPLISASRSSSRPNLEKS